MCVNFIHKWRDLQFKVDSEWQIFWETYHGKFYLLSEFLPEICWEEIAEEILFVFCFDVWPGVRTLAFRLISQHTTYQTTATVSIFVSKFVPTTIGSSLQNDPTQHQPRIVKSQQKPYLSEFFFSKEEASVNNSRTATKTKVFISFTILVICCHYP